MTDPLPNAESGRGRNAELETLLADHAVTSPRGYAYVVCECGEEFETEDAARAHVSALIATYLSLPCTCPSRGDAQRAERRYEALVEALRAAYPRYNCELRPDGSEDPQMAAYVDAWREVDQIIEQTLRAIPSECPMVTVKATQCPYDVCWTAGTCQVPTSVTTPVRTSE